MRAASTSSASSVVDALIQRRATEARAAEAELDRFRSYVAAVAPSGTAAP